MSNYKNKLIYDATTGEIRDDRRFQSMLEDFWMPRHGDGRQGTEIDTLSGGQNLGEIEDVEYFLKRLYKSLNVPISRMEAENAFTLGRATEITRDENKFGKFITRLRNRFTHLFDILLEKQLILKGVLKDYEWKRIKEDIFYDFLSDSYFSELKNSEVLRERIALLNEIREDIGTFYSIDWVKRNVLQQTEEEIEEMKKEIEKEKKEGELDQVDQSDDNSSNGSSNGSFSNFQNKSDGEGQVSQLFNSLEKSMENVNE